jgi:hypothetical protein
MPVFALGLSPRPSLLNDWQLICIAERLALIWANFAELELEAA